MAETGGGEVQAAGLLKRVRSFYKRRPWLAWGGTAVLAGVVIAVVAILAVSGGSEPANVAIKCSVSNSNDDIVFTLKGRVTEKEAEGGCDVLAGELSGGGSYWRVGLPVVPKNSPEVMCYLDAPAGETGTAMVEFNPEGLSSEATTICGDLAHKGWTQYAGGGTVTGPWQAEYLAELAATEEAEAAAAEIAEEEQLEAEAVEDAIVHCENKAEAVEREEISTIEESMKARVAEAPNEESAFNVEEESWAEEEEVWGRTEGRQERCRETEGEAEPGGVELR